jgi:hypothetical protein
MSRSHLHSARVTLHDTVTPLFCLIDSNGSISHTTTLLSVHHLLCVLCVLCVVGLFSEIGGPHWRYITSHCDIGWQLVCDITASRFFLWVWGLDSVKHTFSDKTGFKPEGTAESIIQAVHRRRRQLSWARAQPDLIFLSWDSSSSFIGVEKRR